MVRWYVLRMLGTSIRLCASFVLISFTSFTHGSKSAFFWHQQFGCVQLSLGVGLGSDWSLGLSVCGVPSWS